MRYLLIRCHGYSVVSQLLSLPLYTFHNRVFLTLSFCSFICVGGIHITYDKNSVSRNTTFLRYPLCKIILEEKAYIFFTVFKNKFQRNFQLRQCQATFQMFNCSCYQVSEPTCLNPIQMGESIHRLLSLNPTTNSDRCFFVLSSITMAQVYLRMMLGNKTMNPKAFMFFDTRITIILSVVQSQ